MITIRNIKMKIGYTEDDLIRVIIKKLRTDSFKYKIIKESLDSRNHNDIHYLLTVGVFCENEKKVLNSVHDKKIMLTNERKYCFPHIINTEVREFLDDAPEFRPVIIGAGPAGYFAAIKLCDAGFRPIILERGHSVEKRVEDVSAFWKDSKLNPESNVCYGEGGAGTFSDGKLNTGNKDKAGYFKEVLETFVRFGADESVAYKAKPHIGTDQLRFILINMRNYILSHGGDIRFGHKLLGITHETEISTFGYESELPIYELDIAAEDGLDDSGEKLYHIKTHGLILAIGHSARDTYEMLDSRGFTMERKSFAMGVRVEHKSETINKAMYGENYLKYYGDGLPNADYKLVYHTAGGRDVFSFCMCPGGYVVNSATEEDSIVINGMSYSGRSGENSNSAIVVSVTPDDFPGDDVLAGAELQRRLERTAYKEGNGSIPLQLYGDFADGKLSEKLGSISPEIKGSWSFADLRKVLPDYMTESIIEAMKYYGTRIKGFDDRDTVITAIESRTSSPVRILRNKDDMMCICFPGIIPSGEGAGYAGGITSAAADGIKSAEAMSEYLVDDLIECYKAYETAKYL